MRGESPSTLKRILLMQGAYGGLIIVILYGGGSFMPEEDFLITQSNIDILTQTSNRILVQE